MSTRYDAEALEQCVSSAYHVLCANCGMDQSDHIASSKFVAALKLHTSGWRANGLLALCPDCAGKMEGNR